MRITNSWKAKLFHLQKNSGEKQWQHVFPSQKDPLNSFNISQHSQITDIACFSSF